MGYALRLFVDLINGIINPEKFGISMRCVGFTSVPAQASGSIESYPGLNVNKKVRGTSSVRKRDAFENSALLSQAAHVLEDIDGLSQSNLAVGVGIPIVSPGWIHVGHDLKGQDRIA